MRTCSKCGVSRSVDEFYVQNKKTGRLNPWCKSCYRDWYKSRGGYTTTRTTKCVWCDAEITTPYGRTKFCGKGCKQASKAARQRGDGERKPDRTCVHCGQMMPRTMRSDAKFCSEECNSAAHAVTRKIAKRAQTDKRETLLSRAYIGDRDGWRCHICGGKVAKGKRYPDPLCPSIDHVIPLSRGGTNELSNLRLAHLKCNIEKRDGGGEQLLMFG